MALRWTCSLLLLAAITSDIALGAPTLPVTNETASDCRLLRQYINEKYPLTDPITMPDGSVKFRVAMITDLDGKSVSTKEANTWYSYFKQGYLTYNARDKNVTVEWDSAADNGDQIKSDMSKNGRGLELSELVTFNGQLITLDDKTGLVYVFENKVLIPWVIIIEGDGRKKDAMKNEWATVKDSKLYVGSHGRELPNRGDGQLSEKSYSAMMWVKTVDQYGGVKHLNWTDNYVKVRAAAGVQYPGYMTHESCVWSDVHGRWFFLPRKASTDKYDNVADETKGTNVLLMATPDFDDIKVKHIGDIIPNRGYASFKFVPGTNDTVILAIHTTEEGDTTATYLSVFTIDGEIIYPQTKVSDMKFEGIEFI